MRKEYIKPFASVISVRLSNMIAFSLPQEGVNDITVGSRRYRYGFEDDSDMGRSVFDDDFDD